MIIIQKKLIKILIFIFLFAIGFSVAVIIRKPKVKIGEYQIYINRYAKLNPEKKYQLKLWDYNWPDRDTGVKYKAHLLAAVENFKKLYPNIEVEVELLEPVSGQNRINQALQTGTAPDVYCSAYEIPAMNYKWQIPVGLFLKKEEKAGYLPSMQNLMTIDKYLISFPRWTTPLIWVANPEILKAAGLVVDDIQQKGWTWQDLLVGKERFENLIVAANLGEKGVIPQLLANSAVDLKTDYRAGLDLTLDFLGKMVAVNNKPQDYEMYLIDQFIKGKIGILAGIRPLLYDQIVTRLSKNNPSWEPAVLPAPNLKEKSPVWVTENGVINIYRHRKTKGDDQIVAAVKLGQYLSGLHNFQPYLDYQLMPASNIGFERWLSANQQRKLDFSIFNQIRNTPKILNLEADPGYQEKIYPVLKEYCAGKVDKVIAIQKIIGD